MFKVISIILGTVMIGWFLASRLSSPAPDVISRNGIHWHPELSIKILGQTQEIPEGIGLTPVEMPIHTHDAHGIIHLEFPGMVKRDDLRLGEFFRIWGKTFSHECIFNKCSGQEGRLKMLVNGRENSEFENYMMRDGDKIEIIFESTSLAQIKKIIVTGNEFSLSPSVINVKAGEKIKLTFKNNGAMPHNLKINGLGIITKTIGANQEDIIEFTAPVAGNYAFFCAIPGHKESGMQGVLEVN